MGITYSYPLYMERIEHYTVDIPFIVEFTSLKVGKVVSSDNDNLISTVCDYWVPHDDETIWKHTTFTPSKKDEHR